MEAAEQWGIGPGLVSLAKVIAVDGGRVQVTGPSFGRASAQLATTGAYEPCVGDAVLVAGGDDGRRYVVGVVRALRQVGSSVKSASGAEASLSQDERGEVLRLHDASGQLLFEHHPELGRSIVHAPLGSLELRAAGDLELSAGGAVRVRSGTDLDLEGGGAVRVATAKLGDGAQSALTMEGGRAALETERLGVDVTRADVRVNEANLVANTLRTVAGRVKHQAQAIEIRAERLVERTKESWRETEGLSQTRAGRIRMVAEQAFHAIGERAVLKARQDVKIKGEKIYLA